MNFINFTEYNKVLMLVNKCLISSDDIVETYLIFIEYCDA